MPNSIVSVREDQIQAIVGELVSEDGRIYTTSMQVAGHFGKQHKHVLEKISGLIGETPVEFNRPNFRPVEFVDAKGEKRPAYRMTRDGFTLLAMGFTGKKALQFTLAYIGAFNKMEEALAKQQGLIPYSIAPGQTLSAEEAQSLRDLLENFAQSMPRDLQAQIMRQGWSKLKSHFKVGYRQIPQSEYTEAMSIVTRHVAEWELVDDEPRFHAGQYETLNQLLARLAKQLAEPNGYSVMTFMPLYEEICRQLGHSPRYVERLPELLADPGFDIEPQLLSQINQAAHQRLMQKLADAYEGMEMLGTAIRRIKGPKLKALPA